jgi:hypothetical protein
MLIVFVFAAAVALMLYQQVPRVAFETQRDKEMLLIERGGQFKRAIQLYYVAYKKWPSKIEDLEKTNDKRYLRRRYVDPMTGKDEWRLVHTNGVMLTDSLVQKAPDPANDKNNKDQLAGNTPGSGSGNVDPNAPPDVNAALNRRGSDRIMPGAPGSNQLGNPQYNPNDPNAVAIALQQGGVQPGFPQGGLQGQSGYPVGQQGIGQQGVGQPGIGQPGIGQQGIGPGMGQPGQVQINPNFNPQFPGQGLPGQVNPNQTVNGMVGMPFAPGQQQFQIGPNGQPVAINPAGGVINSQTGGVGTVSTFPGQFPGANQGGFPGSPQGGAPGGAVAPNQAINMINNMLTQPRPAPVPTNTLNSSMPAGGVGLAGVASKYEGPSILVYAERQRYNEWEFIFDLKENRLNTQPAGNSLPGQNQPGGRQGPGGNSPQGPQGINGMSPFVGPGGIGPPPPPPPPTRRQ